jgi:hypothetical protein
MAIVESAQIGSKQGRERAFSELKAMEAGYNRAAVEMDARIRAEQAIFQYEVLMPLELAKKRAEVEYSRARARALQESQLTDTVTLTEQEMQDNNILQSAAMLPQIIEGTSKTIDELDSLIKQNEAILASLPKDTAIPAINTSRNINQKQKEYYTAQRDELIKEKENLLGLNSALGAKLHKIQKSINSILSAPIGTSTKSAELKRSALIRGQVLQQTIDNLASINPEALRSYNMSVAMEYIDLLENQEQKDKYMLRIVDRATPLTPEQAKIIYEQVTAPTSKAANSQSMNDVLKNIKVVDGILQNLKLAKLRQPQDKEIDTLISQTEATQKYLYSQLSSFSNQTGQMGEPMMPQQAEEMNQPQAQQPTLDEKERMKRMLSKPIGQNIAEGASDFGMGIVNLANAAKDSLFDIGKTMFVDPALTILPGTRESIINDANKAIKTIDDYNNGQMTRDELSKSLDGMFNTFSQTRRSVTVASFLLTITELPFSDLELNMLRALKSKDPLVAAFFEAREQLSPQTKNDIMDITTLVNRKLQSAPSNKGQSNVFVFSPEELVKELLSKIAQ